MNCEKLAAALTTQALQRIQVRLRESGCRVELPLLEPSGDAISVYVEEVGKQLLVHDGGHIRGLLFEVGPAGAAEADSKAIETLVSNTGLSMDANRGIVSVVCDLVSLSYWVFELARTIAVAAMVIPSGRVPRRRLTRLGRKVAQQIIRRLVDEGFMKVIKASTGVVGITGQRRYVDFTYTVPATPLNPRETNVYILALDLGVGDPLRTARRGLEVATDLSGIEDEPTVRVVYSLGGVNGQAQGARRLIKVAGRRSLLDDYLWDDMDEQAEFLSVVGQELAPMLGVHAGGD